MATPTQKAPSSLDNLLGLVNIFKPSGGSTTTQTTTGGTTTQTETNSSQVSEEQVQAIVKSILEGKDGTSAIFPAEHTAGLYNSSTANLLRNDLTARAAAEAAKLNKVETRSVTATSDPKTSTTVNKPTAQLDAGKTAALALGGKVLGSLANPLVKKLGNKLDLDALGNKISDFVTGSSVNSDPMTGAVMDKWDAGSTYSGMSGVESNSDFASAMDASASYDLGTDAATGAVADAVSGTDYDIGGELASGVADSLLGDSAGDIIAGGLAESGFDSAAEYGTDLFTDEAASNISDYFMGFANGGRVPSKDMMMQKKDMMMKMQKSAMPMKPQRHFANGGRVAPTTAYDADYKTKQAVRVNSVDRGLPQQAAAQAQTQVQTQTVTPTIAKPRPVATKPPKKTADNAYTDETKNLDAGSNVGFNAPAAGQADFGDASAALGNFGTALGALGVGIALGGMPGVVSIGNIASQTETGRSLPGNIVNTISNALGLGGDTPATPSGELGSGFSSLGASATSSDSGFAADTGFGTLGGLGQLGSGFSSVGSENWGGLLGAMTGTSSDNDGGGTYGGDGFGGNNTGGFGGAAGSAGDGGYGGGGDGASAANGGAVGTVNSRPKVTSSAQAAQGGKIPGHDSQGTDNIPIHVSGGEYVIPTDVVDILGEDFFHNIVNQLHKPL